MSTSFLLLVAMAVSSPAAGAAGTRDTAADRLVGQALQAELQGDNAQRGELLEQALRSSSEMQSGSLADRPRA